MIGDESAPDTTINVNLVDRSDNAEVAALFANMRGGLGPANIHRVLANTPDIFPAFIAYAHALRARCAIEPTERELMILRVLERGGGHYELHHHRGMARQEGLANAAIEAVANWETASVFSDRQRLLLRFADRFYDNEGLDAQTAQDMRALFDDRTLVEIALTLALYIGLTRLTNTLHVPID
ncbi:carboxymuconolactone decarboxylase family protein [Sphingosinicella xenopeptidilytica]|uniref:Carboxymuconolactone decarboxylase family protein n=1 Tax=Sphingosinicella xenopeptidilytica TaxID=364098 RepID=A0ABW3C093_SPHXN